MDAREEQSHHGDEVMSLLSYKDENKGRKNNNRVRERLSVESFPQYLNLGHWLF